MEFLFTWIEKYITIFLLFAVMSYMIPQETYRKYIRFFMELVCVLLLIAPIFSFFIEGKVQRAEHFYRSFTEEMEQREREAESRSFLDEGYMEYVMRALEEAQGQEGEQ